MRISFRRDVLTLTFCSLATFLLQPVLLAQNTIHVKGRVVNESGQPLPRATVQVRNGQTAVVTDDSGNFEIVVASDGTLVITSVGYNSFTVRVQGRPFLDAVLQAAPNSLDQVVVVGYGTQKKRDVTGAVTSVSEQALRSVPVSNLQNALQGQAAGLDIATVGTKPGSGGQIRIRGMRSILGSNDPLLVLDGIPFDGNLNDINPDDVASVEVLKDASATAIYGSRGANGVILVTTKRGRSGEARVSFSGYYGIGSAANKYPVFNSKEYQAMRNISTWGQGYQSYELINAAKGVSTNWQDLVYQNSLKTDDNISVSGGSNGNSYSLGGGYYKETTVLPGQDFTRYSLRATIDNKIGRRVKVGLNTLNTVGIINGSQLVNPMFDLIALSPLMTPYDSLGKLIYSPVGDNDDKGTHLNPLYLKHNNNNWVDRIRRLRTFNSLYGEYQIIDGLKYRINLGLSYVQEENDQFQGLNTPTTPNYISTANGLTDRNRAYVNNSEAWGYTAENLLIYDKTFARVHRVGFTGLYSVQEYHTHNTSIQKDSITDDFVQFYNMALSSPVSSATTTLGGGEQSWALISYMGRLNYAYDDRYLLTATYRRDGSSRLAPGHKWHQYFAGSVGWNILNESFMKNNTLFSGLKLRAGFGQTSNQSINPYSSLGLVSNSNGLPGAGVIRYNYGPTIVTGYNVISLPNNTLDWEYTQTINLGLDFGILRNRITGSLEYYHQHTKKVLANITLPPTSGVSGSFTTNIGEVQNDGMEFSLSTVNIEPHTADGFSWSTDLNLFFNRNKLLQLFNGFSKDIRNQLFVGASLTSIYDYKKQGIWQQSEAAQAAVYGSTPGQIKLEDRSGPNGKPDGVISQDYDRYIIGNGDPKLQGGMTNRFAYKNFDLSIVAYARFGGLLISQVHQPPADYLTVMDGKRSGIKVDYWTPTNPTNWFPSPAAISTSGSAGISPVSTAWTTLGYYSATFVRIRSINLGYTLPMSVMKKLNTQSLRVYFTVDNAATLFSPFMKQTGIDPVGTDTGDKGVGAASGGGSGNIRSNNAAGNNTITINASTPIPRTFILGVNLTF